MIERSQRLILRQSGKRRKIDVHFNVCKKSALAIYHVAGVALDEGLTVVLVGSKANDWLLKCLRWALLDSASYALLCKVAAER
jgi:hypothetical protein